MATMAKQVGIMDRVEMLFERYSGDQLHQIEKELLTMGFIQKGADPAEIALEHAEAGLLLNIELDETGKIHGYELLPFDEVDRKQEKFRW